MWSDNYISFGMAFNLLICSIIVPYFLAIYYFPVPDPGRFVNQYSFVLLYLIIRRFLFVVQNLRESDLPLGTAWGWCHSNNGDFSFLLVSKKESKLQI